MNLEEFERKVMAATDAFIEASRAFNDAIASLTMEAKSAELRDDFCATILDNQIKRLADLEAEMEDD